jgi:two-component system chemotaxis sensor kinase CheA
VKAAKDPYRYFRIEARELLHTLSEGVLEVERGRLRPELVLGLLRAAHTLKGAARVVRLPELASQAHAVEDALAPLREPDVLLPDAWASQLLGQLDAMSAAVASLGAPAPPTEVGQPRPLAQESLETVRVEIEEMDRLLEGVTEATVRLGSLRRETQTIDRAVHLADVLVEELARAGLTEALDAPRTSGNTSVVAEELRLAVRSLRRSLSSEVDLVTRELGQVREAADRLRLLPASVIWSPLERAARDAAELVGRRFAFHTSGGEGRLDGHVLAALRDALLHVVRNAIAHGLESEGDRVAAGKPPVGTISLTVERRGTKVAFICRDDGRGIDEERLRREAVRKGAVSEADARAMSAAEWTALLLRGGLSTTETVTELSGRGVGMDVVRETARRLHGEATIESERGRGTTLQICVPVSLSALSGLVVGAAGIVAVVPLDAVRRTLRLSASDVARAPAGDSIVHEGRVIPFIPLATVLERPQGGDARARLSAIIVQAGSALAAVEVDQLLGSATVVVRPLPSYVRALPVVYGASLDAEGSPQLVLDPDEIVRAAETGRGAVHVEPSVRRPILVVDDSLTTRMLEQSILESAGYEVDLATSAEEALEKARRRRYGVFVVDVEMPGMDGFEFVTRTRADAALRETPAVLVTSRGSPEDLQRGRDAGASAYVVKGEFDQSYLLKVIREALR